MNHMKTLYKKICVLFWTILIILSLTSCQQSDSMELSSVTETILQSYGVEKSSITSIGDYDLIHVELSAPSFDEEGFEVYFDEVYSSFGQLTDKFVEEQFGFNSVEELKEDEKEQYLGHLRTMALYEAEAEVIEKLLAEASFQLDEKEIADYSRQIVYRQENFSNLFGYDSFDDYVEEELGYSESQFLQNCITQGEEEMKRYLVVGAIAKKENLDADLNENTPDAYAYLENQVFDMFISYSDDFWGVSE